MTTPSDTDNTVEALLVRTEERRRKISARVPAATRQLLGQVFTPRIVADRIAGELRLPHEGTVSVLDPGAGIGSLTTSLVARVLRERPTLGLRVTAVELDSHLLGELTTTLQDCQQVALSHGVDLTYELVKADFVEWAVYQVAPTLGLFDDPLRYDLIIQNPPYRKIGPTSKERRWLSRTGIEVPNLYAAFLSLAAHLLTPGGQMVAITPRSFANGAYFRSFRRDLLATVGIERIRVFHERGALFADSAVLQENIILTVTCGQRPDKVVIATSRGYDDVAAERRIAYDELVKPGDSQQFIHIPTDVEDDQAADVVATLPATLGDLGIQVSTGRVVDFRAREHLRHYPGEDTVPLIYPGHLRDGRVVWPLPILGKPDALADAPGTRKLMSPAGPYTLVKRFSAKEETRRVVACIFRSHDVPCSWVGFENHLNVFHCQNRPLDDDLATGLALWLNSSVLELYFRQFSGHTQVNATDLRNMRYPSRSQLIELGRAALGQPWPSQERIDKLVEQYITRSHEVTERDATVADPVAGRIAEAQELLRRLNFDAERSNERSALILLALLNVRPDQPWSEATNPLLRTVDIMDFLRQHYGRDYKPNTRETVRRRTLHQFAEAALILQNPDAPDRPINSPKWCYQIDAKALQLIRNYRAAQFDAALRVYLVEAPGLRDIYAAERKMRRIPLKLADGREVSLSPGGQNELILKIVNDFCAYFTPGGRILYVGDAGGKWRIFEGQALKQLGVVVDEHGKMPDLVVYMPDKNWMVLIEAAASHGPVDAKRHGELKTLFAGSTAGLVFVSCFPTRAELRKELTNIAWETEIWCADNPQHLIHFNGERFLGPYEASDQ
jgi:adenine-specific DNA-methyltransferase